MAKKIKQTRPELKRYRDMLGRYERYLPMLKLKQQQLQATVREISRQRAELESSVRAATETFRQYEAVLADTAGVSAHKLAEPAEVITSNKNIAGVKIPVYEDTHFAEARYSLFATPAWFDQVLQDLREINTLQARVDILRQQYSLLRQELSRIIQIKLGDEMTAAVGRGKIAKGKLAESAAGKKAG